MFGKPLICEQLFKVDTKSIRNKDLTISETIDSHLLDEVRISHCCRRNKHLCYISTWR